MGGKDKDFFWSSRFSRKSKVPNDISPDANNESSRIKGLISWAAESTPLPKNDIEKRLKYDDLAGPLEYVLQHYVSTVNNIHDIVQMSTADKTVKAGWQEAMSKGDAQAVVESFAAYHRRTVTNSQVLSERSRQLDGIIERFRQVTPKMLDRSLHLDELLRQQDFVEALKVFIDYYNRVVDNAADLDRRLRKEEDARQKANNQITKLKLELEGSKREMQELERRNKETLARTAEAHRNDMDILQQRAQAEMDTFQQRAQAEMDNLQKDNDAFRSALVARQHTKGLSDPEISAQFKRLAILIDRFSRILEWSKSNKESTWPVPDAVLRRLANQRKTKQHIVKSSIWLRLHKNIFSTPFRLFGEEGESLQTEWNHAFPGGDDGWPEATDISEDYRSKAIERCMLSLKDSSSSESARLREEYDTTLRSTVEEILQDSKRVAEVVNDDKRTVQEFVRVAAEFWLAVSAHRCRISITYPSSAVNPLQGTNFGLGSTLIVQPEVLRRGNAKGERLDREQVVKGCEGEFVEFAIR